MTEYKARIKTIAQAANCSDFCCISSLNPLTKQFNIVKSIEFGFEIRRRKLSLEPHPNILCKLDKRDGRRPDLIVMDRDRWAEATQIEAALFVPPEMAIEIVSTNWEEDYQKKVSWYNAFGVGIGLSILLPCLSDTPIAEILGFKYLQFLWGCSMQKIRSTGGKSSQGQTRLSLDYFLSFN